MVYAGIVTFIVAQQERREIEAAGRTVAISLANAFDHEIANQIETLEALATSQAAISGDWKALGRQLSELSAWSHTSYAIRDASGHLLASTGISIEVATPTNVDARVIATGKPVMSDLTIDPATQESRVLVEIPLTSGAAIKILSAGIGLPALGHLLTRLSIPPDTIVTLSDSAGVVVARSSDADRYVHQTLPGFASLTGMQGSWQGKGFAGRDVEGFFVRSGSTGYVVSSGIRLGALEAPLRRYLSLLLAFGCVLVLVGGIFAARISHVISTTFSRLAEYPGQLARGLSPEQSEPFSVQEAASVAASLARSAKDVHDRDAQLARANRDLEARVAERTAEVRRNAAVLATTLDAMDQGLLLVDENGIVALSNRRAIELLDLDLGLMASKPHYTEFRRVLAARGEYASSGSKFEEWLSSGELRPFEPVYERVRANGTVLEVRGVPMPNGGVVRTYTNITARRQAETALREKTAILDATLENMDQGLMTIDPDGVVQVCNERAIKLLDLPADLMRSRPAFRDVLAIQLATNEFAKSDPSLITWVARGGIELDAHVYERERPNGVHVEIRTIPMSGGGAVRTYTDITERKHREAALEESEAKLRVSEERLAHALTSGSDGLWDWNTSTGEVWLSDTWYRMLGYEPGEIAADRTLLSRLVHPDDSHRAKTALQAHLKGEADRYECEYRLCHRSGEFGWFLVRGTVVSRAEDGRALRLVGTHIDITGRKEAESQIAHLARHDPLTNLPNRAFFRTCLDQRVAEVRRGGGEVAVLSLDLDRFKAVNDTLGHPAGDALLWEVAERLKTALRAEDIVARLGGDEFAILLAGTDKDNSRAARVAQRLLDAVSTPVWIEGHETDIGLSIGIAIGSGSDLNGGTLFKRADHALYRAKAQGRGLFRFYDDAMDAVAEERRRIELGLRGAIERGELELLYQPLIQVADRSVCGFEALVRWRDPERGLISPCSFIPVAEETGLIGPIGAWVLRTACTAALSWPDHVTLAVNVSAVQFRRGGLAETVISALASSGLPARRLELEVTESVLMQEDGANEVLNQLRAFGIRIALDDFGTGYSSLSYLRRFPLDRLKIDRSFIAEIADPDTAAIVRAIIGMGSRLGMRVTAEGVETEEQFGFLRAEGCAEAQGYLFSRPVPIADATSFIGPEPAVIAA